ncbi:MAG: M20/M25/M40 family metallo-hydrolase [Actinomycetota bacterium]|nr:M20/M25/M40 family metallo-hydrolase [Actinomycetota bacterium]
MTVHSASHLEELEHQVAARVDRDHLVDVACSLVDIPSPTGDERAVAERVRELCEEGNLQVALQEVEEGRANVLATMAGTGGGPTLMFNGHMDTSYSGREPHLHGKIGFQPRAVVKDGLIWGLGIANMKGAIACYLEAVRAIQDSGMALAGDIQVAAVAGEIETAQWGEEFTGARYRGYSAGSHYLVGHGGSADMCILGEPTEQRIVLGHYGTLWGRISTRGPLVHTAFSAGRLRENSIVKMGALLTDVLAWIPEWEERSSYGGKPGVVNVAAVRGGQPWRLSRTPNRTDLFLDIRVPPSMRMQEAAVAFAELVRRLKARHRDAEIDSEIFVTSPGAEIDARHPLVAAIDRGHRQVFGAAPERDTVRWCSDASVLTRFGIETVNYGASSGLPSPDGENLEVEALVRTAQVYALAAAQICEVQVP